MTKESALKALTNKACLTETVYFLVPFGDECSYDSYIDCFLLSGRWMGPTKNDKGVCFSAV